jgi:hypothetical protein
MVQLAPKSVEMEGCISFPAMTVTRLMVMDARLLAKLKKDMYAIILLTMESVYVHIKVD